MTSHADVRLISRELEGVQARERLFTAIEYLNRIGAALSSERNIDKLLETILTTTI